VLGYLELVTVSSGSSPIRRQRPSVKWTCDGRSAACTSKGGVVRTLWVLTGAIVAALAFSASASATPPTVQVQQFAGESTGSYLCGFPVASAQSVVLTTTTFFDAEGTVVRQTTRSRAVGSYVGPTGLVAWYDQEMNGVVDHATGVQTIAGQAVRVTAPGVGILLHDVGLLALQIGLPPEVLFEAGQHGAMTIEAWAPVCAYLDGT